MLNRFLLVGLLLLTPLAVFAQNDKPGFLVSWPVTPPTDEQILEARNCDIEAEASKLYEGKTLEALDEIDNLETACDWALLAQAYVDASGGQFGDEIPEGARQTFDKILEENPALLLSEMMLYGYIGMGNIVEAPPLAEQPITDVEIAHEYSGIGSHVVYTVKITEADSDSPVVRFRIAEQEGYIEEEEGEANIPAKTVDSELLQALGTALTDFIPIEEQFSTIVCYDNYPDWTVTLTFADATELVLKTNGSNFFNFGGPWQTEIEGQNYIQFSPTFVVAMYDLVDALNAPQGGTAAMACMGFDPRPLDAAFPGAE